MNKSEFVEVCAVKAGLPKSDAERALDAVLSLITRELKLGNSVHFSGFGKFEKRKRKGRIGYNPRTTEPIKINPSVVAKFTQGEALRRAIN